MKTVFKNISQLTTPIGTSARHGAQMEQVTVIDDAMIEVENGRITFVGKQSEATDADFMFDCGNCAVIPAFVDPHTHLVFGGFRESEFLMRAQGASYIDIMRAGGGIINSVKATRDTSESELYALAKERLLQMLKMGITTVEIKSGYGLDFDTEIKQLRVINRLKNEMPLTIKATYMGAHAVPTGMDADQYIGFIIDKVLPFVAKEKLADFVDVFCERGVFTVEQTKRLFDVARRLGFRLKIHADEIECTRGAQLATQYDCISAEHLLKADREGIEALANSKTIATLLPLTAFCLKEDFADARRMIDSGCAVALATDFNPGSCFSFSVPLMIALAVLYMKMSINETLTAMTLNSSASLNLAQTHGSIEQGKVADFIILKQKNTAFLPYHTAINCVKAVVKNGQIIAQND